MPDQKPAKDAFAHLHVEPVSTVDRVADELRRALFDGELDPGTPLREVALAESLGVARSTVREALGVLVAEGLADRVPNKGTAVHDLSAEEIRDVLKRLELEPWDITRTGEAEAKELGVKEWGREPGDRERWIEALSAHPKLIQRPLITADDGSAVVGRSEEAVRDALGRG